ncbi:MAG: hypothetical protein JO086_00235 [Acidimicrobiia bacterium]|nr:hypothetical protein [Acidimicrobiia bacterium]
MGFHVVSKGFTADQWPPSSVVTATAAGLALPWVSGSTGAGSPVPIAPDGSTAGVKTMAPSFMATMWLSAAAKPVATPHACGAPPGWDARAWPPPRWATGAASPWQPGSVDAAAEGAAPMVASRPRPSARTALRPRGRRMQP